MSGGTVHDFKRVLRQVRLDRGYTIAGLAARIGVAVTSLEHWERTVRVPEDQSLRAWAAALEVRVPPGIHGRLPARCGTLGGICRHRRNGAPLCPACEAASKQYWSDYRAKKRGRDHERSALV